jgi:hypothetical protein
MKGILQAKFTFFVFLFSLLASASWAQAPLAYDAADIATLLKRLPVSGTILYVAAHPDDENTRLIAYLAQQKGLEVYYLSLTRGDGGQNLIGNELGDGLGVIRTQELLAARRVDGGKQLFSRARDFGFSKNPEETFKIWNRREVLRDAVKIIRDVQPDVIITRFSPDPARHEHPPHSFDEPNEDPGRSDGSAPSLLHPNLYRIRRAPSAFNLA